MTEVFVTENGHGTFFALDWSPAGSTRTPAVTSSSVVIWPSRQKFFAGHFAGSLVFVSFGDHHESPVSIS